MKSGAQLQISLRLPDEVDVLLNLSSPGNKNFLRYRRLVNPQMKPTRFIDV